MKDKPSDFTNHPFESVLQHTEDEIVAANIMKILKRTGDTFRPLTKEEYTIERLKDGSYTLKELGSFDKVIEYCQSPDTACLFSKEWE